MATERYGVSEQNRLDAIQIAPGLVNGKIQCHYDEHAFATDIYAIGDTIKLGKLPKGAKVKAVSVIAPSLGTVGKFKLGYAVTEDDASDRSAALLADTGIDLGGQAVATNTVLLKAKLEEESELVLTCTEASDDAVNVTVGVNVIKVLVEFIVD